MGGVFKDFLTLSDMGRCRKWRGDNVLNRGHNEEREMRDYRGAGSLLQLDVRDSKQCRSGAVTAVEKKGGVKCSRGKRERQALGLYEELSWEMSCDACTSEEMKRGPDRDYFSAGRGGTGITAESEQKQGTHRGFGSVISKNPACGAVHVFHSSGSKKPFRRVGQSHRQTYPQSSHASQGERPETGLKRLSSSHPAQ